MVLYSDLGVNRSATVICIQVMDEITGHDQETS